MKREALLALAAGFRESNPKLAEHGFVTIYPASRQKITQSPETK